MTENTMESKLNSQNSVIGKVWKMKQTTQQDMEQHSQSEPYFNQAKVLEGMQRKNRWSKEELIEMYGEEKYYAAEGSRQSHERAFGKDMGEFILVPSLQHNMISIISARTWDKGKNDVGEIIHDKIFG